MRLKGALNVITRRVVVVGRGNQIIITTLVVKVHPVCVSGKASKEKEEQTNNLTDK